MATNISGPHSGGGLILGNPSGDDVIEGFGFNNLIFCYGANDQIFTGAGGSQVDLGSFTGVTVTVNLGGAFNLVYTGPGGHTGSTLTVQGGTGHNHVNLVNTGGNNNVLLQGFFNIIDPPAETESGPPPPTFNILTTGAGNGTVRAGVIGDGGTGLTSVVAAGQNNSVIGGDQDFNISGGQGSDFISVGNGTANITEAGLHDVITVGTGADTITDYGGNATVTLDGAVHHPTGPHVVVTVNLAGGNNTVIESDPTSDRDITIPTNGGSGSNTYILGNGTDVVDDQGANCVVVMGTPDDGDGDIFIGNGNADRITIGDGNNGVLASGNNDVITLGNGNNHVQANGNTETVTAGNGNNSITALGNGDTITLGTGNNTVLATGNTDIITSNGGVGTFTIGSPDAPGTTTLTLNGTAIGTTVDLESTSNIVIMNADANATINDSINGGAMHLIINADGGGNAGIVVVAGFDNDSTQGMITLTGFGPLSTLLAPPNVETDGAGGTLIHLGTGSLDLLGAAINPLQFST